MKTTITTIFCALCSILGLRGQNIKQLYPLNESRYEQQMELLNTMNRERKDTLHKESILSEGILVGDASKSSASYIGNQHFPYPIIFIHGLASSSDTWMGFYNYAVSAGWSFGGVMDFALNSDNDNSVSSLTEVIDYTGALQAADFYAINFNVDPDGTSYGSNYSTTSLSNMDAIYKQGLAVKLAIQHVMQVTGKDKVILFGHSMGGLASRQYIQNPNIWQADNMHHVAKLVTTGTPHGGSNLTGTFLLWPFTPDEASNAVRDLRRSYFYSNAPGVFLFGGLEDNSVMDDNLFYSFYDNDVNCNGVTGETIVGLNQKTISTDIDYSCITGDWSFDVTGTGDGVVDVVDAQIKTFYPTLESETFVVDGDHISLPDLTNLNFLAFDEPDKYQLSYTVLKNTDYNGYITPQTIDSPFIVDNDFYNFSVSSNTIVSIYVKNIYKKPFGVSIYNQSNVLMFNQTYMTDSIHTLPINVASGNYYLKLYATGDSTSWQYPYWFRIETVNSIATGLDDMNYVHDPIVAIYPNPSNGVYTIESDFENGKIEVINILGDVIKRDAIHQNYHLDISEETSGVYYVKITAENKNYIGKIILTH